MNTQLMRDEGLFMVPVLRLIAIFAVLWSATAWASGPETLQDGGRARVISVVDGDTVVLTDGRQVRLVGIQAPKLALGRANFKDWPLADEAKRAVEEWVLDQDVHLYFVPAPQDRHGRVLAHVTRRADGLWLQGELLKRGLARVYTFPDNRVLAAELLAFERQARSAQVGIWALVHYMVRTPYTLAADMGTFQIVEGRVLDTAQVKKNVYVNFGKNWRSDFTIKVGTRDAKLFAEAGIDLLALKGKRVRVRGWIKSQNGPMIELDHPERLEILEAVQDSIAR
jgi:endonuclease YncB( thermonuclease family)